MMYPWHFLVEIWYKVPPITKGVGVSCFPFIKVFGLPDLTFIKVCDIHFGSFIKV